MRRWHRFSVMCLILLCCTTLALGASVHFKPPHQPPTFTTVLDTLLNAKGELAGLGNGDVVVVLSATADATTTCTNHGGNQAPGQNPGDVTVAGSQAIPASEIKNGNTPFNVTTQPPHQPTWEEAGCPGHTWVGAIDTLDFTSATIRVYQNDVLVLEKTFVL